MYFHYSQIRCVLCEWGIFSSSTNTFPFTTVSACLSSLWVLSSFIDATESSVSELSSKILNTVTLLVFCAPSVWDVEAMALISILNTERMFYHWTTENKRKNDVETSCDVNCTWMKNMFSLRSCHINILSIVWKCNWTISVLCLLVVHLMWVIIIPSFQLTLIQWSQAIYRETWYGYICVVIQKNGNQ